MRTRTKLFATSCLLAAIMPFGSVAAGEAESPVRCAIVLETVGPQMARLAIDIGAAGIERGTYSLMAIRRGQAGTARTAQNAAVELGPAGTARIDGPMFSLQDGDLVEAQFSLRGPDEQVVCATEFDLAQRGKRI